jgi:hypothetical protein
LHVGLPKTGTTTLQAGLFQRCPGVTFVGKFGGGHGALFAADWMEDFRRQVNYGSDFGVAEAAPRISALVSNSLQSADTEFLLLSLEGITNPFVDTLHVFPKGVYLKARHTKVLLNPLIEQGTGVRILITIRDQTTLLPSLFSQVYMQAFSSGLIGRSYDSFLDFLFSDETLSFGSMLFYDKLCERYGELFGEKNVFLVAMEELFANQLNREVEKLANFLAVNPQDCVSLIGKTRLNVRNSGFGAAGKRRMAVHSPAADTLMKHLGKSPTRAAFGFISPLLIRLGKPILWALPDRSERIASFYRKSNERLLELYDVNY